MKISAYRLVMAAVLALSPAAGALAQEAVEAVAVMPLGSTGLSEADAEFMTERLMIELARAGGLQVMERSRRDELLREREFQQSGPCDAASCLIEAGRLLAVRKIVGGAVGQIGQVVSIQVRMIDIQTGSVDRSVVRDYTGSPEVMLTRGIREVALELVGKMVSQPKDTVKASAPAAKTQRGSELKGFARTVPVSRLRAPQLTYGSLALAAGFGMLAFINHRQAEGFYAKYQEASTFEQMDLNRQATEKWDKRCRTYTFASIGCAALGIATAFFRRPPLSAVPKSHSSGEKPRLSLALRDGGLGPEVVGRF